MGNLWQPYSFDYTYVYFNLTYSELVFCFVNELLEVKENRFTEKEIEDRLSEYFSSSARSFRSPARKKACYKEPWRSVQGVFSDLFYKFRSLDIIHCVMTGSIPVYAINTEAVESLQMMAAVLNVFCCGDYGSEMTSDEILSNLWVESVFDEYDPEMEEKVGDTLDALASLKAINRSLPDTYKIDTGPVITILSTKRKNNDPEPDHSNF